MFLAMHRTFSFAGGLALGLVFLAVAAVAAEYSGAFPPGLPSPDPSGALSGKIRMAENSGDASQDGAHKNHKPDLDNSRKPAPQEKTETKTAAPKPAKKQAPASAEAAAIRPQKQPVPPADTDIDHIAGRLILLRFSGADPSDAGPKAIRTLIHDGLIAGVMFSAGNIQSKSQLKELTKFFVQSGGEGKPLLAISEIGGARGVFPRINDFEAWPSERDVASKGDPEYAYLTYRSLGAFLAGLGFTLNFGPKIGTEHAVEDDQASFADAPLQAGVFAKTFILGHMDGDVIAVPLVDGGDVAVRSLKTLLVSYPAMPIAVVAPSDAQRLTAYEGLVRGPRFCFVALKGTSDAAEAASALGLGCDVIVVDGGKENPAAIRELVVSGVSNAIKNGALMLPALQASGQRLLALRQPAAHAAFTTRTAH